MYFSPDGPYGPNYVYYAAAHEERRQLRRTSSGICFAVLAAPVLMNVVVVACAQLLGARGFTIQGSYENFYGLPPVLFYLLMGVEYLIGVGLPALLYFAAKRMPLSVGLPFRKTGALTAAAYVFFGVGVCMLANIPADAVAQIQRYFGFSGTLPSYPLTDDWRVLALYAVNVCVIPPIVEEMLFRGAALQSLRRFGDGFAVVASAALFGLYHANFIQMVFAFLCGLAMGYAVIRTGSLLPSILIHFTNNALSFALDMVQRYGGESAMQNVNNVAGIALIALGAVGLVYLIASGRERPRFDRCAPSALPFSSRIGSLFANAGAVFFIAYALISSVMILYGGG